MNDAEKCYRIISAPSNLRANRKDGRGNGGDGHVVMFAIDDTTLETRIFMVGNSLKRVENEIDVSGRWTNAADFNLYVDEENGRVTMRGLYSMFDSLIDKWRGWK